MMNLLRELMIERIYFVMDEDEVMERYMVSEEELIEMSAEDFLDVYDEIVHDAKDVNE